MSIGIRKYVWLIFRLLIAGAGVAYVLDHVALRDQVLIQDPTTGWPRLAALTAPARPENATFWIADPTGGTREVTRDQLLQRPDRTRIPVFLDGARQATSVELLGSKTAGNLGTEARSLLIVDPHQKRPRWIDAAQVPRGQSISFYPLIQTGLAHTLRGAKVHLLLLSLLAYPIALILTTQRWKDLMAALGIRIGLLRTFHYLIIGAFYNSFMPGSTGGDVVRAVYASRYTPYRTRAVLSVLVDRAIGLVALIIFGGALAAIEAGRSPSGDPAGTACGHIAVGSAVLIAGLGISLLVFYQPGVRRLLERILPRLPMRKQVGNAFQAMDDLGRQPGSALKALLISFPAHGAVVLSALLAGKAMGLGLSSAYYFVAVPVIVLAGVLPLAPQGAGVMEFFAVIMTQRQGASVSQALALALAIRLVPMVWSLIGAWYVVRGAESRAYPSMEEPSPGTAAGYA